MSCLDQLCRPFKYRFSLSDLTTRLRALPVPDGASRLKTLLIRRGTVQSATSRPGWKTGWSRLPSRLLCHGRGADCRARACASCVRRDSSCRRGQSSVHLLALRRVADWLWSGAWDL